MFIVGKETNYDPNTCGRDILSKKMIIFLLLKSGSEMGCKVLNELWFWFCSWYDTRLLWKNIFKYIQLLKSKSNLNLNTSRLPFSPKT